MVARMSYSELRIRMKLLGLRKLDEKTEQQANIINSGQIDLWLQEHHQELDELLVEFDVLRGTVSHQVALLHAVEKNKIDRVIINQIEVLERESKRIKKSIQDNLKIAAKLREYNRKQELELKHHQESYVNLTKDMIVDVDELLDMDIDQNMAKYWQLLATKDSLERHIDSINLTVQQ